MSAGLRRLLVLVVVLQATGFSFYIVHEWPEIRRGESAPLIGALPVLVAMGLLALVAFRALYQQASRQRDVEHRLELVTERTPTVVWTTDRELRLTSVVGPIFGREGVDPQRALGQNVLDASLAFGVRSSGSSGAAGLAAEYEAVLRGESVVYPSIWDGRSYDAVIEPLRDESGEISGTIGVAQDVSERVLAQKELRAVLENLPDAIARIDRNFRYIYANPAAASMSGLRLEELLGKTIEELGFPHEATVRSQESVRRVFDNGAIDEFATDFESPEGLRHLEVRHAPEFGEDGRVANVLAVIHDGTERWLTANSLREGEERFRVAFELAPNAMLLFGDDLSIRSANSAAVALFGYSQDELTTKTVFDITHPDDLELTRGVSERIFAKKEPTVAIEKRYLRKGGEVVWGRLSVSAVRDADGKLVQNIAQIEDVTELKQAEQALREREALQRAVIENATDLIAVVDREGLFRLVSRSVTGNLGYEPEEVVGRLYSELIHPDDRPEIEERVPQLLAGEPPAARMRTLRVRHKNGEWRVFEATGAVSFDEERAPLFLIFVLRDITERTLLERQLRQARTMEAIGQLAGGIAHDFNNLLTAVNGYADIALQRLGDEGDPELRSYITEIRRGGERAAGLTQRLLAFSGRQVLRPEPLDLNAVLAEYRGVLGHLLGTDIELVAKLASELGTVEIDPDQLGQILTNLAMNAREAMPRGGTLEISTESVTLEHPFPHVRGTLRSGHYTVLSVADTGEGIDAETREHLFEPFFTTRETGRGSGLGLPAVLGVVEQSGGAIEVLSEPGSGATFRLYFPCSERRATERERSASGAESGSAAILVVEDDDAVRKLVAKVLTESGYLVHIAATPTEALELARSAIPIDALVTDVVLPEMNGHELAQKIRSLRPGLRVLYTSGYAPEAVRDRGVLEREEEFIQKPFSAKALISAVNRILE